jgi:hypothetical protein
METPAPTGPKSTPPDACYFLGLAGDRTTSASEGRLFEDEHPEVREVAAEALALLGESPADLVGESGP